MYEDEQTRSPKTSIGFAAAWAATLSLTCVFIGEGAQQFAGSLDTTPLQFAGASAKKPAPDAIDFTTTGAIKGQTGILSPCER